MTARPHLPSKSEAVGAGQRESGEKEKGNIQEGGTSPWEKAGVTDRKDRRGGERT